MSHKDAPLAARHRWWGATWMEIWKGTMVELPPGPPLPKTYKHTHALPQVVGRYMVEIWKALGMDMEHVQFISASGGWPWTGGGI